MAYTAEQQGRIDAANLRVANTGAAYNAAVDEASRREQAARTIFNSVMLCSGYRGRVVGFGILNPTNCALCGRDCGDCGGAGSDQVTTCKSRVGNFNTAYNYWNSYRATVTNALNDWNTAKTNLQTTIGAVELEVKSDPEYTIKHDAEVAAAEEAQRAQRYKYIFYIVAALVVAGGLFAFYKLRTN